MNWDDIFADGKAAIKTGLGRLVEAKVTEQVERIDRKADPLADTVRGMTVSPVNTMTVRENSPVDTMEGLPAWQKGALAALAVVVAAVILRRMG